MLDIVLWCIVFLDLGKMDPAVGKPIVGWLLIICGWIGVSPVRLHCLQHGLRPPDLPGSRPVCEIGGSRFRIPHPKRRGRLFGPAPSCSPAMGKKSYDSFKRYVCRLIFFLVIPNFLRMLFR